MKKLLLATIVLFILIATNPSLDCHRDRVAEVWAARFNARAANGSVFDKLKSWFGANDFAASVVAQGVQRGNYLIFSVGVYEGDIVSFDALNCVLVL